MSTDFGWSFEMQMAPYKATTTITKTSSCSPLEEIPQILVVLQERIFQVQTVYWNGQQERLEKASQLQVLALSTGRELELIPNETAAMVCKQWLEYPNAAEYHFAALTEILDQESREFRD